MEGLMGFGTPRFGHFTGDLNKIFETLMKETWDAGKGKFLVRNKDAEAELKRIFEADEGL
jgi:hypothetical protein